MIKLDNITIKENIIMCDIYPEDSIKKGILKVDFTTKEILEYTLPENYEYCKNHISHAKNFLLEMIESGTILKTKTIMWY